MSYQLNSSMLKKKCIHLYFSSPWTLLNAIDPKSEVEMSVSIVFFFPSHDLSISFFSVEDRGQRVTAHWISHGTAQQETETAFKVRH